jgi:hypothetical protein
MGGTYARTGLPTAMEAATYDAANQITEWDSTAFTYDANGNLTDDGPTTYTWNARNQLTGLSGGASAKGGGELPDVALAESLDRFSRDQED